jgi:hypothetical protein
MIIIRHQHTVDDDPLWFMTIDEKRNIIWTEDKNKAKSFPENLLKLDYPTELTRVLDYIIEEKTFPIILENIL